MTPLYGSAARHRQAGAKIGDVPIMAENAGLTNRAAVPVLPPLPGKRAGQRGNRPGKIRDLL
ncbi:hypothetical protein CYR40_17755 [Chimaeribacter arupi]|jgi:hypothetical protein|uniref:Uncharacterized protein n=1 Tax=Chimaeribacter arupi TaxID=2060066 RepID=A0A2N5ELZ9_9GAMM|nr:hypothetical protein CYR23_09415 [Chimaeribacter arupi]PLR42427.1 hypothetical protein CYR52_21360 [Chimaeribacter arupi]PLR43394.1 hypothetical protein CYR40_17755 [Chimaeribacter arupi]PLR48825.1 hypothetical protein CYR34_11810 [Chimaeribacter arupi]